MNKHGFALPLAARILTLHSATAILILLVAFFFLSVSAPSAHQMSTPLNAENLPASDILPEGTIQVSPTVPRMGEHWANPADLPLGPIYCVHEGKIVCLEFMIAQEDFANGKSWPVLAGMEGLPPVNHVNVGFEPQGHEGYEIPHYDVHMYFVAPEELDAIQ